MLCKCFLPFLWSVFLINYLGFFFVCLFCFAFNTTPTHSFYPYIFMGRVHDTSFAWRSEDSLQETVLPSNHLAMVLSYCRLFTKCVPVQWGLCCVGCVLQRVEHTLFSKLIMLSLSSFASGLPVWITCVTLPNCLGWSLQHILNKMYCFLVPNLGEGRR